MTARAPESSVMDQSTVEILNIRAGELVSLLQVIAGKSLDVRGNEDCIRHVQHLSSIATILAEQIEGELYQIAYPGCV